jgi:hypothetical protein
MLTCWRCNKCSCPTVTDGLAPEHVRLLETMPLAMSEVCCCLSKHHAVITPCRLH